MGLVSIEAPSDALPAMARGGPVDGTVLGTADGDHYEVVIADHSRWDYVKKSERATLPDGRLAVVFECRGRV